MELSVTVFQMKGKYTISRGIKFSESEVEDMILDYLQKTDGAFDPKARGLSEVIIEDLIT